MSLFFEFENERERRLYHGCADVLKGTKEKVILKPGGEPVNLTTVSDALAVQGFEMHTEQMEDGSTEITCTAPGIGKAPLGIVHTRNINEATKEYMKYKEELRKNYRAE